MEQDEYEPWTVRDFLTTFLIATIVAYLLLKYIKWRIWAAKVDTIPGPRTIPFLGNTFEIAANRTDVFERNFLRFKNYGPIFRMWFGSSPVVVMKKAEHTEHMLSSTKNLQKSLLYRFVLPWLGESLITSHGPKWQAHRKLITPTFHYKMLEIFLDVFITKSNILLGRLESKCNKGVPFDLQAYITHATLDIICETALGTNVNAQQAEQSEYVKSVYQITKLIAYRTRRMWLYPDCIFKLTKSGKDYFNLLNILNNYTKKIIQERKETRSKISSVHNRSIEEQEIGMKNKTAFLDLLLKAAEDGENIDENSIREEVNAFMFAGHDTTATGISFCLYLLGLHPECQERVAKEIINIVGEDGPITISDVAEMKYLDLVLKEVLRIYSPVPVIGRILEEDIAFDNFVVPAGTSLTLFIYFLHRDERFFPDPEKFDPDRFLPENTIGRHPYAYLPFSAGSRNCIGQKFALLEEKVIIATILRKFKISSLEQRDQITLIFDLVLKSKDGIKVRLDKRNV